MHGLNNKKVGNSFRGKSNHQKGKGLIKVKGGTKLRARCAGKLTAMPCLRSCLPFHHPVYKLDIPKLSLPSFSTSTRRQTARRQKKKKSSPGNKNHHNIRYTISPISRIGSVSIVQSIRFSRIKKRNTTCIKYTKTEAASMT